MKRIIAFIAALAFVSGGIISAQEQEREQVQEQEPIREYSKFRFGLEGGGGFRLGKISNDVSDDFKSYTLTVMMVSDARSRTVSSWWLSASC